MKNFHLLLFLSLFFTVEIFGQNPSLVKDIAQSPRNWVGSYPTDFTEADGKIFFSANERLSTGIGMWRSDGTDTELISDLTPVSKPVSLGNSVFWLAYNTDSKLSLWRAESSGMPVLIEQINALKVEELVTLNGALFYRIGSYELWKSTGNPGEAEMIYHSGVDEMDELVVVGDRIYFKVKVETSPTANLDKLDIWSTDGTTAGTEFYERAVGDPPVTCGLYNVEIFDLEGRVSYTLRGDGSNCDYKTWLFVDGFAPILEYHYPIPGRGIFAPVLRDGKIYYISFEQVQNSQIEFYLKVFENGRSRVVKTFSTWLSDLKLLPSGNMIFRTSEGLWSTDGTDAGTKLLGGETQNSILLNFASYDNGFVFTQFKDGMTSFWKTDGTTDNTLKITDFSSGTDNKHINEYFISDNTLWFSGNDGQIGAELWRLDLTAPGTTAPPLPLAADLIVEQILMGNEVDLGSDLIVEFVLKNIGTGDASEAHATKIYLSEDNSFSSDDLLLGQTPIAVVLEANSAQFTAGLVNVPANLTPNRTYYILGYIDPDEKIAESDETNNVLSARFKAIDPNAGLPDLVPMVRSLPTFGEAGSRQNSVIEVRNEGLGESNEAGYFGLFFSKDSVFNSQDILLERSVVGTIAPGETGSNSIPFFTVPNEPSGNYYLISVADYEEKIAESDKTNNYEVRRFEIRRAGQLPDLVAQFTNMVRPIPGANVVAVGVGNRGEAAPGCEIGYRLSVDRTISPDDIFLGSFPFDPISAGNSGRVINDLVNFPSGLIGTYYLIARVDEFDEIPESDENNNVTDFQVVLNFGPPPGGIDLELSFDALSNLSPDLWSVFSPKLTVTNNGPEDATLVRISLPRPAEVIYQGGNEATTSKGAFKAYGGEVWNIGNLAAGESATLQVNYFRLQSNVFSVYAQVIGADQSDSDSTPDNGTCCFANEDDEADISVAAARPVFTRRGIAENSKELFNINAFPNPFSNEFKLELISIEKTNSELLIFDAVGKLVLKKAVNLAAGFNSISVDASHLPKGVFTAKIEGVGEARLLKIID